jgi:hypothetical protein
MKPPENTPGRRVGGALVYYGDAPAEGDIQAFIAMMRTIPKKALCPVGYDADTMIEITRRAERDCLCWPSGNRWGLPDSRALIILTASGSQPGLESGMMEYSRLGVGLPAAVITSKSASSSISCGGRAVQIRFGAVDRFVMRPRSPENSDLLIVE